MQHGRNDSNEVRAGTINHYGCHNADCTRAYKELPFPCVCYLCAQSVEKHTAVISFKDDHGQWHSNHHDFEACMSKKNMRVFTLGLRNSNPASPAKALWWVHSGRVRRVVIFARMSKSAKRALSNQFTSNAHQTLPACLGQRGREVRKLAPRIHGHRQTIERQPHSHRHEGLKKRSSAWICDYPSMLEWRCFFFQYSAIDGNSGTSRLWCIVGTVFCTVVGE